MLMVDVELYLYACHNFKGDITKAVSRSGYNVKDVD